jgi:hypothetical protein
LGIIIIDPVRQVDSVIFSRQISTSSVALVFRGRKKKMGSVLRYNSFIDHCVALSCFMVVQVIFVPQSQAQFTTIYNVPPDVAPSSIGTDTQLNLFEGGWVGSFFRAGASDGTSTNVEVNVFGGFFGRATAYGGSRITYFPHIRGRISLDFPGGGVGVSYRP